MKNIEKNNSLLSEKIEKVLIRPIYKREEGLKKKITHQ